MFQVVIEYQVEYIISGGCYGGVNYVEYIGLVKIEVENYSCQGNGK